MCVRRRLLSVGAAVSVALLWAALTLLLMSRPPHPVSAAPNTLYVAPPPTGDDANPCSASDPCATVQHAVDVAHADDEIQVATGVYTGVQARDGMTQVLFISKTVTVRGGYSPGFGRWNPAAFPTTLDAQRQGRVVSILGAGPTLEGLIITGGDATSVTLNCPTAGGVSDGCGGGVFVFGGSPLIVGNVISGNIGARSVGSHSASGGGLLVAYGNGSVISGNLIMSNTASTGARGMGGGIHLQLASSVLVTGNRLIGNSGTTHTSLPGWGGAIAADHGTATSAIVNNRIEGNRTNGNGTSYGAAIYTWYGSIRIADNDITGNIGTEALYLGNYTGAHCEANRIIDNDTSVGIRLVNGYGAAAALTNNIVARNGSAALSARSFAGGPLTVTLAHNTLVGDGTGSGVYVESGYATLYLTNTIIASHVWGVSNTMPASSTVLLDHTLFWANGQNGDEGLNALVGDPRFVDPGAGDFHIGPHSAAVDAAAPAGAIIDVDGDARPMVAGWDIGADEAWWRSFIPLTLHDL